MTHLITRDMVDEMRRLYVDEGKSTSQIAAIYGVAPATIHRRLVKATPMRPPGGRAGSTVIVAEGVDVRLVRLARRLKVARGELAEARTEIARLKRLLKERIPAFEALLRAVAA